MAQFLESDAVLLALFALGGWMIALSVLARISGWSELAEYYQSMDPHDGEKRPFQSISMQRFKLMPAQYNGAVTLAADVRGLRMETFILFRPGHPPLTIPWSEISTASSRALFFERIEVKASRAPGVVISIARPTADWIAAQSGGLFQLPSPAAPQTAPHGGAAQIAALLQSLTSRR